MVVSPRKLELNSGNIIRLTIRITPTAASIGYKIRVAEAVVTVDAVEVKVTMDTMMSSRTKTKSLGVFDRINPWKNRAKAKKAPLMEYAAGELTLTMRELKYRPKSAQARPRKVPARARIKASTNWPNLRPGWANTVVIAPKYAAGPRAVAILGTKQMLTVGCLVSK